MKAPTPTETANAIVLPQRANAAVGNAAADPLAALLSFAEQMLARQQPAPSAQPAAAAAEADTDTKSGTATPSVDLAGTLPQALAVALQMQPPVAVPPKASGDDAHEETSVPVSLPVALPASMPTSMPTPAPLTAPTGIATPTPTPTPTAQDLAPVATARTVAPVSDADVDAKAAAKDDDGGAAPALPVLAGNNAAASTDTKFSLPQAAPALRLPHGDAQQWQSPLLQALGDRIQLQLAAKSDTATIRLEPPQMGRVDIAIRQDAAGSLQVNLSATHGEVVHQLQQISEGMRWNLAQQRQGGDVVVQVSAAAPDTGAAGTGRDGSTPRQPWQQRDDDSQRPGRALAASDESTSSFALS